MRKYNGVYFLFISLNIHSIIQNYDFIDFRIGNKLNVFQQILGTSGTSKKPFNLPQWTETTTSRQVQTSVSDSIVTNKVIFQSFKSNQKF